MTQVMATFPHKHKMKPFKYEMMKRKEQWKSIFDSFEKMLSIPPEAQSSVVQDLVSEVCYNRLVPMLNLSELERVTDTSVKPSVDTIISYLPPQESSLEEDVKESLQAPKVSSRSTASVSTTSSRDEASSTTVLSKKPETPTSSGTETGTTFDDHYVSSDYVELEKKTMQNREMMLKHKAVLRFLTLPEGEAATWRVKDAKDVSDLSQMTLEEQGDFLINKIAVDFCNWIRELGGDEKSFISEEIVKELFQIGMDNPASRAICMKTREKRVLYYKLAEFLQMPEKSFHKVLSKHLNWDAEVEKKPSRVLAFGKSLPRNLRFKTPKNKTGETWLEWNKLSDEQLSFADVYKDIKDLRSTKEYCKWMAAHPEHKKPQYLVDQHMFEDYKSLDLGSSPRYTILTDSVDRESDL